MYDTIMYDTKLYIHQTIALLLLLLLKMLLIIIL